MVALEERRSIKASLPRFRVSGNALGTREGPLTGVTNSEQIMVGPFCSPPNFKISGVTLPPNRGNISLVFLLLSKTPTVCQRTLVL
jgi:hypothetical protein